MNREQLILEYWQYAKGIGYNTCYVPNLKEECMSVATEALINAIDSYDPSQNTALKSWITFQVKTNVIDFLRKERHSRNNDIPIMLDIDDLDNCIELSINGLDERIQARDLLFKILFYVSICKKKRKNECELLVDHYYYGQLQKDIAEYRGCTPQNVNWIIRGLREIILEQFGDEL